MNFKSFTEDNISETIPYILNQKYRICDFSIGSILIWRKFFNYEYALDDQMLYIKGITLDDKTMFAVPIGFKAFKIDCLIDYCKKENIDLLLSNVPTEAIVELEKQYQIEATFLPDWFDYLYDINDLKDLKGKKFQAKRNHINKFSSLYPQYIYKNINQEDFNRIKNFNQQFIKDNSLEDEFAIWEMDNLDSLFNNYQKYHFIGGYLEVNQNIVAYTIGEIIDDTLYVHVEKASREYQGSYATINNEFIKHNYSDKIKFVNREEDVGDLGLRKAKESYHPIKLLNRYDVKIIKKL